MTIIRTTTVESDEDKRLAEAKRLDDLYFEMSKFVSEHGPKILTLGMTQREANEAILECLRFLGSESVRYRRKTQLAKKLIDQMRCHSTGDSCLHEPDVSRILEEFYAPD